MNFARTQSDVVWVSGYQPPTSDFEDLERKAFQGLNGKVGGVYAPTSPIVVTGSGLHLNTQFEVVGSGVLKFAAGATLTLAASDYPKLLAGHVGRTHKVYQAMAPVTPIGQNYFAVMSIVPMGAVQAIACDIRRSTGTTSPEFIKRLRVHHASKLARIRLRFKVPTEHPAVPRRMPRLRLFRVRVEDGIEENLVSTTTGDGFVELTRPNSGDEWHKGGAVQEFVLAPTSAHTIDNASYSYFLHVQEEVFGLDAFPLSVRVYEREVNAASTVPNQVNGTCDGVSQGAGKLCLFKNELAPSYNGVWSSPGGPGAWTRAPDMSSTAHFANGMLIPIAALQGAATGLANPGTVWQMVVSQEFVADSSPVTIRRPVPMGTIFMGVLVECEDVAEAAFQ